MKRITDSSRTSWTTAWLGLIAGVVVAFVFFVPASLMATAVKEITNSHVLLSEPRGTFWNGSARLIITGGVGSRDAMALPGRMQWTVRPLFVGVRASIAADCCTANPISIDALAGWGGGKLVIADGQSKWPAALLAGLGTPWNTMEFDGGLLLSTQQMVVTFAQGRAMMSGSAGLDITDLSSSLSTLRPVGSYRIKIQGGPVTTLDLSTLQGNLKLEGKGEMTPSGVRFQGTANATPEREGALANLLSIIGRRSGAGSIITIG